MTDIVERLRRYAHANSWAAGLKELTEAANEIERLREALIWCSAASDFRPGGHARQGWEKLCQPLIRRACELEDQK